MTAQDHAQFISQTLDQSSNVTTTLPSAEQATDLVAALEVLGITATVDDRSSPSYGGWFNVTAAKTIV